MSSAKRFPDFTDINVAAGGSIGAALTGRRVLVAMCHNLFFVIAHAGVRDAALEEATELDEQHEGFRPVFVVLLTDEHLAALTDGVDQLNVAVLSARRGHRTAPTAIKVNARSSVNVLTTHGTVASTLATTLDMRAGDVYTCGTPTLGSDEPGFTVYRALADYDPDTGRVNHHIVEQGWKPGERVGALTDGPNTIVYRADDPAEVLARYGLTALATAN